MKDKIKDIYLKYLYKKYIYLYIIMITTTIILLSFFLEKGLDYKQNITSSGELSITSTGNINFSTGIILTGTGNLELSGDFLTEKTFLSEKLKNLFKLDFLEDSSYTKFVNNEISFKKIEYEPTDLQSVESDYIENYKEKSTLRNKAKLAFVDMSKDFFSKFNEKMILVSAYRSYIYQKGIKDGGCPDNLCAKPGYSEHQTGLAVDLFEASDNKSWESSEKLQKYYKWLDENAYNYGFVNTYKKGIKVDGYDIEPWHWRYVGKKIAKYLKDNDLTFAEFYKKNSN